MTAPARFRNSSISPCRICAADHVVILIETDFPADGVRRDLRHHRRRPGPADHQHRLPDLRAGADPVRRRQRLCRRLVAVVIANIVAFFLVRVIGRNLEA